MLNPGMLEHVKWANLSIIYLFTEKEEVLCSPFMYIDAIVGLRRGKYFLTH